MLKLRIVGADSIGVRSMAAFVEADDVKIAIDPGVSFAPRRYGLPPHPIELERVEKVRAAIIDELDDTDVIVITHYHYDHYLYQEQYIDCYRGKILILKNPSENINLSQKLRAHRLLKKNRVRDIARQVRVADGSTLDLGSVRLAFSNPVPHGARGSRLGYVVMVLIETKDGTERFVHASDVQGPADTAALEAILSWKPSIVFVSGPPIYLGGGMDSDVSQGLAGLRKLAQSLRDTVIIADHHLARDIRYPTLIDELRKNSFARIVSAAEYMGVDVELLEAKRRDLWRREAPGDYRASGARSL